MKGTSVLPRNVSFKLLVGSLLLIWLAGCSASPAPLRYYRLQPTAVVGAEEMYPDLAIGVGPISLADMLKRNQLVTRVGENEYRISKIHYWAGLLEQDVAGVLVANLRRLLGTDQISLFPWGQYNSPRYRVVADIQELTGEFGGEFLLRANWGLVDAEAKVQLHQGVSEFRRPLPADIDYPSLVQVQSALLTELSRDIAAQIRTRYQAVKNDGHSGTRER